MNEESRYLLVDQIDSYLNLNIENISPSEISEHLPLGWIILGEVIKKFFTLYPDVIFKKIYIQKGILRIEANLDKSEEIKYLLVDGFLNSIAKMSSMICMVSGEPGTRAIQIEEQPCLNLINTAFYLTGLTERGRL